MSDYDRALAAERRCRELTSALVEVASGVAWFDLADERLIGAGTVWIELSADASNVIRSVFGNLEAKP